VHIDDGVIAVTGASSGIGRATARALAGRRAHVVLLARRGAELNRVAQECAAAGTPALAVPVDVTDADAVEAAAARAVERFGRLDGWVNCAAVTMFGSLLDTPIEDVRRVLEVNLMGYVHGARAALPHMIAREHGVLVNVSSILGVAAQPYGAAYTMSKFAIRGLSGTLRQELRLSGARGVKVSTVLPAAIDTPIYATGANYSGRTPTPPPPVYSPERVAATIVKQLRRPRRQVVAGGVLARAFLAAHTVAPGLAERVLADEVDLCLRRDRDVAPTDGNLRTPAPPPAAAEGGWHGRERERARAALALAATAGAVAAAVSLRR
jgi:NAD(P)-dependent dehydrogenase (short-subunit alcohol dehydrogenase family)